MSRQSDGPDGSFFIRSKKVKYDEKRIDKHSKRCKNRHRFEDINMSPEAHIAENS